MNNTYKAKHSNEVIQQRLAIIKDALVQVKASIYVPENDYGTLYFRTNEINEGDDLKSLLPTLQYCNVCIKGALFLSAVKFNNQWVIPKDNLSNYNNRFNIIDIWYNNIHNYFELLNSKEELFNLAELDLVEIAFDRNDYNISYKADFIKYYNVEDCYLEFINKIIDWSNKFSSRSQIMIAILENMLANNSYFIID